MISVGGDAWNKAAAERLEREFIGAKPTLEKIVQASVGQSLATSSSEDEEQETPYIPESWEEMTEGQQDEATEAYFDKQFSGYLESEQTGWYDNGGALDDAKSKIVYDFGKDLSSPDREWADEALTELRDQREESGDKPIPYSNDVLLTAITLEYEGNGEGGGDLSVDFDDSELRSQKASSRCHSFLYRNSAPGPGRAPDRGHAWCNPRYAQKRVRQEGR